MRMSPKDLARALYLATRQEPEKKAAACAKNLIEVARRHGLERTLGNVLAALPSVMEEIDAEHRITIESAREIDDRTVAAALEAAGISTENAEVVRKVSPHLIGGIRIKTRDSVVDATVRRTMDELAKAASRPASSF